MTPNLSWWRKRLVMSGALAIAACTSHAPPPHTAPPPHRAVAASSADRVKIGQPYFVLGHWYTPADDRAYDITGIASWYGPGFHALSTASGERYDQDAISAAQSSFRTQLTKA